MLGGGETIGRLSKCLIGTKLLSLPIVVTYLLRAASHKVKVCSGTAVQAEIDYSDESSSAILDTAIAIQLSLMLRPHSTHGRGTYRVFIWAPDATRIPVTLPLSLSFITHNLFPLSVGILSPCLCLSCLSTEQPAFRRLLPLEAAYWTLLYTTHILWIYICIYICHPLRFSPHTTYI